MNDFILRIAGPAQSGAATMLPDIGLAAGVDQIRWTVDARAGMGGATFSLPRARRAPAVGPLAAPIEVPLNGHVELWHGSQIVYEGVVMDYDLGNGGVPVGIVCAGYQETMNDDVWTRTDLTSALTAGEVLRQALSDLAPWLTPGTVGDQWIDPQIQHPGGMSNFARMTAWQMADQIMQDGDTRGRDVWVMVMPGRRVWLVPRVAPPEPHYVVPFDERVTRFRVSRRGMAATVIVESGSGGSTSLTSATTTVGFASRFGFAPRLIVPTGGRTGNAALALRNREAAARAEPTIAATISVDRDPRSWLTTRHGVPAPFWSPIPGEWIQIAGQQPLPIVSVSVDATGGSATYELGATDPALPKNMWVVTRDAIARQRQMLASNGGRLRT